MLSNKRQEKLLYIFIENTKIISGNYLCEIIGVSSRTVRTDIKQINSILKDNGADIISEKGKGYRLVINDNDSFERFKYQLNNRKENLDLTSVQRVDYIIKKFLNIELNNQEWVTQLKLADELFISVSSLKSDFKLVKSKFSDMEISLEKYGNNGVKIVAKEESLRIAMSRHLSEEIFKKNNCLDIKNIFIENIKKFNLRFSDNAYKFLIINILIMIIRASNKKNIEYSSDDLKLISSSKFWDISKSIAKYIEEKFHLNISLNEIAYITKQMEASSLISINQEFIEIEIHDIFAEIIESINKKIYIDFSEDKILEKFLCNHLNSSIKRARYGISIENTMLPTIKNSCPIAFEIAILASKVIKKHNLILSEDEIGFLALHFEAALERHKNKNKKAIKKAILMCDTGIGTSLVLKIRLENHFKDRIVIIDTKACYEVNETLLDTVDIVISTVKSKIKSDKIIFVGNLLNNEDINKINLFLDNVNSSDILIDSFDENIFFRNVKGRNSEEILNNISNKLLNKNYINNDIKSEILKRENLSSTEIGDLVAIPHVVHKDIKKSFISVTILEKSVCWDVENVQVVFLIGVSSNDAKSWGSNLEKLYRGLMDLEIIKNIIDTYDFKSFINI